MGSAQMRAQLRQFALDRRDAERPGISPRPPSRPSWRRSSPSACSPPRRSRRIASFRVVFNADAFAAAVPGSYAALAIG